MLADVVDNYDKLPAFLKSFELQNPGSRVCCQLDSNGRAFRVILSVSSLVAAQDNWVPVLEWDGTHMKNAHYICVCVLFIGKDGNWTNIPVAVAFIHKGTAENFKCFLQLVLLLVSICMIVLSFQIEEINVRPKYDCRAAASRFT